MAHPALAGLNGVDWVDVRILEELGFLSQDDGYSTPSRQYLAQLLGCTVRTITRHLTKLVKLGYLQRKLRTFRTPDGKIRNRTNLYRVALAQAARIKAFFGALGGRVSGAATGGTPMSSVPRNEENIQLQKDTVSPPKPQTADKKPPQPQPWEKPAIYHQSHRPYLPNEVESAPLSAFESNELLSLMQTSEGMAQEVAERFLQLGQKAERPTTHPFADSTPGSSQEGTELSTLLQTATGKAKDAVERFLRLGHILTSKGIGT